MPKRVPPRERRRLQIVRDDWHSMIHLSQGHSIELRVDGDMPTLTVYQRNGQALGEVMFGPLPMTQRDIAETARVLMEQLRAALSMLKGIDNNQGENHGID